MLGANAEMAKIVAYPAFDWLRFLLSSIVVLVHEGARFPGAIDGSLAVDVFFALSGWLIGGILLRTAAGELPRFFFNRATRIWLPYFAAIVLLYGFAAIYEGAGWPWAKYLFFDSTFTHQIWTHFPQAAAEMPLKGAGNQFWSISVEEQFYLLAPAVMLLLPFGKKLAPWIVLVAFGAYLSLLGISIALGVIAAILQRDLGDWHARGIGRIAVLGVTIGLFVTLLLTDSHVLRAIFSIGVVLSLAVEGKRRAIPVFLGGISYPVYLNHWVGAFAGNAIVKHALHMQEDTSHFTLFFVAVAYPASLVFGTVCYLAIDRVVLTRRGGWYSRALGKAFGAAAYVLLGLGLAGGAFIS